MDASYESKIIKELKDSGYLVVYSNYILKALDQKLGQMWGAIDMRYPVLSIIAHELVLQGVKGAIAEVGVYKGVFAKRIRALLPGRTFYLFDTFEGFSEKQLSSDKNKFGVTNARDFSDTTVETVLATIGDSELCVIRKGLFPQTAEGIDDTFAFVSLDVDLYEPIYDGLAFFYERLAPGGYILVHDFFSRTYPGCRQAVLDFCNRMNIGYVPMPDRMGSAVITKR